jgi:hypothetical protein
MSNDIAKLLADVRALLTPVLGPVPPPRGLSLPPPIAKPRPHRQQKRMLKAREKGKAANDVTDPSWISVSATKARKGASRKAQFGANKSRPKK